MCSEVFCECTLRSQIGKYRQMRYMKIKEKNMVKQQKMD